MRESEGGDREVYFKVIPKPKRKNDLSSNSANSSKIGTVWSVTENFLKSLAKTTGPDPVGHHSDRDSPITKFSNLDARTVAF